MNKILTLILILISLAASAITSPLATPGDYRFTSPVNTNFIQGKILGPNPPSYGPVRGEDQIYLYEAFAEMNAILSAQPSTVITNVPGIDTYYLRINYPSLTGRPAFYDIYHLFSVNTNGNRDVLTSDATVVMPTNLFPYSLARDIPAYISGDAAVYSHAAVTSTTSMAALGVSPRVRYLAVTNVAAFYSGISDVKGIAKDFYPDAGTDTHTHTVKDIYDTYSFSSGDFTYRTVEDVINAQSTGGGLLDYTSQQSGIARRKYKESFYLSKTLHSSRVISYAYDDELTATLFTTSMVRASNVTPRQGWLISTVYYTRDEYRYVSPTNYYHEVSIETNFVAIVPVSLISVFETNGVVVAQTTPDYGAAWDTFFNGTTDFPYPDDIYFPQPPTLSQAFATDEVGSRYNETTTRIDIKPFRLALILDIDWHTGFTHFNQQ